MDLDFVPPSRRQFQDQEGLDLGQKMMKIDHRKRITGPKALEHPFFAIVMEHDQSALKQVRNDRH
jgi:hypothetical protein